MCSLGFFSGLASWVSRSPGRRIARLPGLNPLGRFVLPRRVIATSLRNVYGNPDKVTSERIARYYELTLCAGNRQALAERLRQVPSGAQAEQIATLKLPTLIL